MKNIKTYEEYKIDITFEEYLKKINFDYKVDILNLIKSNLIDLNGIEKFHNLDSLNIDANRISSLDPLENLTKLGWISLDDNKITSLKSLKKFNFHKIYCEHNQITSLDGIENSFDLVYLNCPHNKITSIKAILNLNKLKSIFCDDNPIDWVDYIDKQGNTWYIELPKCIKILISDKFETIKEYWEFMEKNQPAIKSRKFNF